MINELWHTSGPRCARCQLELFPGEWFICNQCRFESEHERVLEFVEVCMEAARMDGSHVRGRLWRIA